MGTKSAERYAFQMLTWKREHLQEMAEVIRSLQENLQNCSECGSLIDQKACPFCTEERAQTGVMCIIASPKDVFAIEKTREYRGLYHVLGGLLSPMEGLGPDRLSLGQLKQRMHKHQTKEVIIAVDSTLEGDTTALYLKKELDDLSLSITRLAFGLPMGSSLDYVDGGTLARALMGRGNI